MKKIFKITFFVALALSLLVATLLTVSAVSALSDSSVSIIGGADGPTTILISDIPPRPWVGPVLSGLVILLCVIGIIKTRKK